ncbi:SubName: Full=Uncharacterized protein {ECO:0000313/EMBL:CCA71555.1} [Serendipita indica DSM 11827]|nr:SubName: Full=Uncharacterized protein {ECO:0000313/EMBL:CCA71555.1} [Serendipita indica DSM 11827]
MYTRDDINAYKDTLNVALEKLTDGASKKRIVGLRIIRTGTLLELDSAKSAKWLKENNRCAEMVKEAYTSREEETKVIPRAHELMVRFVPVDFDPHEEESLHSVELENGLPPHSIISASWIKDLSRRYEGQGYANVKINCASPEVANRMILGPTRIGNHSVKVQKEHRLVPICAKCSHHDHFLAACKAERFTCRFCAQEHSSRDCPDKTQTKCTPCGSSQHSSGDERCIESKSRQDRQAEHAPEMRSKFFFTKDQWTYNESINAPWNSGYLCPEIETETSQEQAGKQLTMAAANASQGVTNKSRKINQTRNRQITLAQYSIPMQAARSVQHPGPTPKTQTTPNSSQETTSSPSSLPPAQTQPSIATTSPDDWDVIAIQEPALNSLGNTRANRKWQSFYPSTKAHEGHGRIRAVMLVSTCVGACMQIDVDSSNIVGIRVGTTSGLCTIYNIYNEGTSNDTLDQLTQHLETRNTSTWANRLEVWLGDFNRHHHTWEGDNNRHLRSLTDTITPLLNLIIEHSMQQLLPAGIPTREENGSQTRPDNVWASDNIVHRLVECNTWPDLCPTTMDHIPIASIIDLSVAKVAIMPRPNYRRTNWEKFREGMEDAVKNDPRLAIEPTRPEELEQLVELLTGYMQTKLKDTTPLSKDPTFRKPWWNKQCQDLHKCKCQAYTESRYWQASPAHPSHQFYKALCQEMKEMVQRSKEAFWWKWIDEASDTDLWNINRFIKRGAKLLFSSSFSLGQHFRLILDCFLVRHDTS